MQQTNTKIYVLILQHPAKQPSFQLQVLLNLIIFLTVAQPSYFNSLFLNSKRIIVRKTLNTKKIRSFPHPFHPSSSETQLNRQNIHCQLIFPYQCLERIAPLKALAPSKWISAAPSMIYNINSCPDCMPERKAWSKEEDRILRVLKEERGEKKWSTIAKLMQSQFGVSGRTGKQCRQRYHNHLDAAIVAGEWSPNEEATLFHLHEAIGNKWSMIAQQLPGRSDNCVKNHFYSRLRKAVRRLNKFIGELQSLNEIRISLLYKIIQTTEQKFKNNSKISEELVHQCNQIKNQLYKLEYDGEGESEEKMGRLAELVGRVEARFKKNSKKHKISMETMESRNDMPQLKQIQENMLKKEADEELSYYRIIKQVCQELVVSKYQ